MMITNKFNFMKTLYLLFSILGMMGVVKADETKAREVLVALISSSSKSEEAKYVEDLTELGSPIIANVVASWRVGEISYSKSQDKVYIVSGFETYEDLLTGAVISPDGDRVIDRPSRKLRKKLSRIVDFLDLKSPDLEKRMAAARKFGSSQKPEFIEVLREFEAKQDDPEVAAAFRESIAMSLLENGTRDERIQSVKLLGDAYVFAARDNIAKILKDASSCETVDEELVSSCKSALISIDDRQALLDIVGTLFRGLSTGSVLLLVSYGLAITFGQMGVINMAHGEFIALGGYSVYLVQNYVLKHFGESSVMYEWYFVIALPIAFGVTALAGCLLEKGLIQFLYKRPLESLLATWAVSMIMQQALRLYFGAANVSVSSPEWLSGSYDFGGVMMSYNRIALIVFAIFVVIVTSLLLSKTNWGLHVRATMQNRQMASSLGVPSSRVNMLTFAFGSGLAGLAGAFIAQIGNVGPSMGQTYIVDSFMVVVVGGVGNLMGAAISSLGIGLVDQGLQPLLGPVMGKISVLFGIILFLQFRPGGIFPARSRSLDD